MGVLKSKFLMHSSGSLNLGTYGCLSLSKNLIQSISYWFRHRWVCLNPSSGSSALDPLNLGTYGCLLSLKNLIQSISFWFGHRQACSNPSFCSSAPDPATLAHTRAHHCQITSYSQSYIVSDIDRCA